MALYSVEDLCERYSTNRTQIDRWTQRGIIKVRRRVGTARLYSDADIKRIDNYLTIPDDLVTLEEMRQALGLTRQGLAGILSRYEIGPVKIVLNRNYYPRVLIDKIRYLREHYKHKPQKGRDARIALARAEGWHLKRDRISEPGDPEVKFRYAVTAPGGSIAWYESNRGYWCDTESEAWDRYIDYDTRRQVQSKQDLIDDSDSLDDDEEEGVSTAAAEESGAAW
jgi:DNA-binding transcriptional MerR regulator